MSSIWKELMIKFILHSTIFGILIYFLNDYCIQKALLVACSFGILMTIFNWFQLKNKK